MKITFLGTGAGLPSKDRNTQTTVLDLNPLSNEYWLFDAGEAAQHRILNTNIKLGKLTTIFITHLHGDHLFGLPGLLTSRSFQGGEGRPLKVIGPRGIKLYVETTLMLTGSHLNYPLEVLELNGGEVLTINKVSVNVQPLKHGISSLGYRLKFPPKEGRLKQQKLLTAGIEPGPIYKEFKTRPVVTYNGEEYITEDYKEHPEPGKVIAFFGDTMPVETERLLADHADVMIHESTYLDGDHELSHKYFHSHIDDVIQLAAECHVKMTLINHVSNRYTKDDIEALTHQLKNSHPEFNFQITEDYLSYEI
ncbi:MBL fold metallo-hydrolase [Macrococcus lamae]|uniref:Ribonuclease Z n=1 Tax=Macrococcus lamae TaxID=198484 RepID=A0A4R6BXR1_9STAP|nr:MBL fold metallo-hydrolase [Macrococcus lamae]TDM13184.1 MBL fold metallo-hydrolase [Macrococcus lamae]